MNIDLNVVTRSTRAVVGSASLDDASPVQLTDSLPGVAAFSLAVLVGRFGRPVVPADSLTGGSVRLMYPDTGAEFVYAGKLYGVTWFGTDAMIDQAATAWGNSIGLAVLGVGAAVLVGGILLVKALR